MTTEEQLHLWVQGKSVHNDEKYIGKFKLDGGECCPDFSCCYPKLKVPKKVREAYLIASTKDRNKMLGAFLNNLIKYKSDIKAIVTTGDYERPN